MGPRYHFSFLAETIFSSFRSKPTLLHEDLTEGEIARLNHYFQCQIPFRLSAPNFTSIPMFKKTAYSYDFYRCLRATQKTGSFKYAFGDIRETFGVPTFTKSRPIGATNQNSILLPLEFSRHFYFPKDTIPFSEKANKAIFRGACYQPWRQQFLEATKNLKSVDAGDVAKTTKSQQFHKPFMPIQNQLRYKAIISIEGNDVASNLKWALNSNSVVIMTEPKFETWFCEAHLKPWIHYIPMKDDYSDLSSALEFVLSEHQRVEKIVENANKYCSQYFDTKRQFALGAMVMDNYFKLAKEQ